MLRILTGLWLWGNWREYKHIIVPVFIIGAVIVGIMNLVDYTFGITAKTRMTAAATSVDWHYDPNSAKDGYKTVSISITNPTDEFLRLFWIKCKTNQTTLGIHDTETFVDVEGMMPNTTVIRTYKIEREDSSGIYSMPSCWITDTKYGKPSSVSRESFGDSDEYEDTVTLGARNITRATERERAEAATPKPTKFVMDKTLPKQYADNPDRPNIELHSNGFAYDTDGLGVEQTLLSLFVVNKGGEASMFKFTCINRDGSQRLRITDGSGSIPNEQSHHFYLIPSISRGPFKCEVTGVIAGEVNRDMRSWVNRYYYVPDYD